MPERVVSLFGWARDRSDDQEQRMRRSLHTPIDGDAHALCVRAMEAPLQEQLFLAEQVRWLDDASVVPIVCAWMRAHGAKLPGAVRYAWLLAMRMIGGRGLCTWDGGAVRIEDVPRCMEEHTEAVQDVARRVCGVMETRDAVLASFVVPTWSVFVQHAYGTRAMEDVREDTVAVWAAAVHVVVMRMLYAQCGVAAVCALYGAIDVEQVELAIDAMRAL